MLECCHVLIRWVKCEYCYNLSDHNCAVFEGEDKCFDQPREDSKR